MVSFQFKSVNLNRIGHTHRKLHFSWYDRKRNLLDFKDFNIGNTFWKIKKNSSAKKIKYDGMYKL